MQINAVNQRARRLYGAFISAMDMVGESFDALDKLIEKVDDKAAPGGFTVATKDELKGMRQRAFDELDRLRSQAKKYEAELVSRDWRI
ncbi:hypothetical protein ACPZ19_43620 [Amycolatopsis lurida]